MQDAIEREIKRAPQVMQADITARVKALQVAQNSPRVMKGLREYFADLSHANAEYVSNDALFSLGLVASEKRSKDIVGGLKKLEILAHDNTVASQLIHVESIVDAVRPLPLGPRGPITAKEARGLESFLHGLNARFSELGRNISLLPVGQRSNFLFYAGVVKSPSESHGMMVRLIHAGILDQNFLPQNGGEHFERYINNKIMFLNVRELHQLAYEETHKYAAIREALFGQPLYTQALPAKETHILDGLTDKERALAKDIRALPLHERRNWMFYAGHAQSRDESILVMSDLVKHGVLNQQLLPLNGTSAFDAYVQKFIKSNPAMYPNDTPAEIVARFDVLRDALFAPPKYAEKI